MYYCWVGCASSVEVRREIRPWVLVDGQGKLGNNCFIHFLCDGPYLTLGKGQP